MRQLENLISPALIRLIRKRVLGKEHTLTILHDAKNANALGYGINSYEVIMHCHFGFQDNDPLLKLYGSQKIISPHPPATPASPDDSRQTAG